MTARILSNGRKVPAFDMAGGQPGALGINRVVRVAGTVGQLGHIGQTRMKAGDVFEIHTAERCRTGWRGSGRDPCESTPPGMSWAHVASSSASGSATNCSRSSTKTSAFEPSFARPSRCERTTRGGAMHFIIKNGTCSERARRHAYVLSLRARSAASGTTG